MPDSKPLFHCDKDNLDFTDGAEAQNIVNLTGKPLESLVEGEDFGEGVCPNCGNKAEHVGEHEWHPDNDYDPEEGDN